MHLIICFCFQCNQILRLFFPYTRCANLQPRYIAIIRLALSGTKYALKASTTLELGLNKVVGLFNVYIVLWFIVCGQVGVPKSCQAKVSLRTGVRVRREWNEYWNFDKESQSNRTVLRVQPGILGCCYWSGRCICWKGGYWCKTFVILFEKAYTSNVWNYGHSEIQGISTDYCSPYFSRKKMGLNSFLNPFPWYSFSFVPTQF